MGIGEAQALARKAIEVGRLYFLRAITPEVAIANVIGQDENDVGK